MQITRIEKTGRRCRIWLNDEPAFLLYAGEVRRLKLEEGQELTDEALAQIKEEILKKRACLRCLHLLESQDRTEQQLRRKLEEGGCPPDVIDAAIEYVKGYHYLDDSRYARMYIDYKGKSKSTRQIRQELLRKGVSASEIDAAMQEAEPVDTTRQIRELMRKKGYDPATADRKEKQRFLQLLLRRGYTYGEIREALDMEEPDSI